MKYLLSAAISSLFVFYCATAQVSSSENQVSGIWMQPNSSEPESFDWRAQWIWLDEKLEADVLLARSPFSCEQAPKEALLRISASSKYELYINGSYICQGPARSAPHHQSYDILQVAAILKKGKNSIAVRVHHQKGKYAYHLKGRAGLLAQLDIENQTQLVTNNTWKVHTDPSWNSNAPSISRFQKVVNDRVDLIKKIKNWQTLDFDDASWKNATPLLRNTGWPAPKKTEKATTLTTPWTSLVPRDIPYLIEQDVKATKLIEAVLIDTPNQKEQVIPKNKWQLTHSIDKEISKSEKHYRKKDKSLILPPTTESKTWLLIFDFESIKNGFPKFTMEGSKGTQVDILSAPFIVNDSFTHRIVDSNLQDQVLLSGGLDTWQATYFKPSRYLAIAVKGNTQPVKINYVGTHQIRYPFSIKGSIQTPEAPWMEDLWKASIKTIDACTTDAFTDNYRERRQYAQTGYYAALGNYWTYGDTALQRRYLIQVAQEQEANGMMPAYAPLATDEYMIILDSNCLYIRSLYNYYLYSGDQTTVHELLPAAKKLMALLHSFTDKSGLLNSPPYSYWLDHALNDRTGANLCLNGHYLGALNDFNQLLTWLGDDTSNVYLERANRLSTALASNFWDADKGLFADAYTQGKLSSQFSEHGNGMALASSIGTPEQVKKVANALLKNDTHDFIKRANGMTVATPALAYFIAKGLADNGYEQAALNMLYERFNRMLAPETNGTLWEEWWRDGTGRTGKFQSRTRSDAQTESAFPPALFVEYIVGLQVTEPGMKVLELKKPKTELKNISANLPTPQGALGISWKFGSKKKLELTIPTGVSLRIKTATLGDQIMLNKKKLNTSDSLLLQEGEHILNF